MEVKEIKRTWLSLDKIKILKDCLEITKYIPGHVAELGVANGGSAKIIADECLDKKYIGFDTFSGIPNVTQYDNFKSSIFKGVNYEDVKEYLRNCKNITLIKGIFPESANEFENNIFSFVHFDGDSYESCKSFLDFFYFKMSKGGIMLFDDYDCQYCPGIKKAIIEFFDNKVKNIKYNLLNQLIEVSRGQAIIWRIFND